MLISIDDLPVENINDIQFHLKGEQQILKLR